MANHFCCFFIINDMISIQVAITDIVCTVTGEHRKKSLDLRSIELCINSSIFNIKGKTFLNKEFDSLSMKPGLINAFC